MSARTSPATGKPAVDPDRRRALATIHVARKALQMAEDDYRHLLERITGHRSAAHCDAAQLDAAVAEFVRLGFRSTADAVPRRRPADHPVAKKARALWISLHQLAAIDDASEAGLEVFAKRQLKVDRLQWADQSQGFRLIEALKAMGERHGWDQTLPARLDVAGRVRLLKERLVAAQIAKLTAADAMPAAPIAGDPAGWTTAELDRTIRRLAQALRAHG